MRGVRNRLKHSAQERKHRTERINAYLNPQTALTFNPLQEHRDKHFAAESVRVPDHRADRADADRAEHGDAEHLNRAENTFQLLQLSVLHL